jgi:hypothetical protein
MLLPFFAAGFVTRPFVLAVAFFDTAFFVAAFFDAAFFFAGDFAFFVIAATNLPYRPSGPPMLRAISIAALMAACGREGTRSLADAPVPPSDAARLDDGALVDDAPVTAIDAPIDTMPTPDAFPAVLDLRIDCHNTCVLTATPSRIDVPAGTSFEVNWINVGDTECDVAKIDPFNQVPIIIGLEPGTSYHDTVREWCGMFTGTFDFRISICTIPSYIPVDCSI